MLGPSPLGVISLTKFCRTVIKDALQPPISLPIVEDACYNSEDVKAGSKCHENTRAGIQRMIRSWASNINAETLFWLHGPAGTGKSTLARTLADSFSGTHELAAGYFFKRGDIARNDTARIFPTIASQLMDTIPHFKPLLRASLESSSRGITEKTALEDQFKILILDPLSKLLPFMPETPTRIIIIDALDECTCPEHMYRVLSQFSLLRHLKSLRLCVFFTSRFDPPIKDAVSKNIMCRIVGLHTDFYEETKVGIEAFIRRSMAEMKTKNAITEEPWPKLEDLTYILKQSTTPSPLFIYAATLIRFIDDKTGRRKPTYLLNVWMDQCLRNESQLTQIYIPIVDHLLYGGTGPGGSESLSDGEKSELLNILGSLILLARALPVRSLAALLGISESDLRHWLKNLHAVIVIPGEQDPVEIMHKSFSDFLLGEGVPEANSFRINASETHHMLANRCIEQMSSGLHQNICKLDSLAISKNDIQQEAINRHVSIELGYACVYWVYHLLESKRHVHEDEVYPFLEIHFLHWIELLSIMGKLPEGAMAIKGLLDAIAVCI